MSGNKDSGKLTSKFCRCIVAWQALASKPVVNMPMHKLRLNKEAMAVQFCSQKIVDLNFHATSNPRAGGSPEPPQAEVVTLLSAFAHKIQGMNTRLYTVVLYYCGFFGSCFVSTVALALDLQWRSQLMLTCRQHFCLR